MSGLLGLLKIAISKGRVTIKYPFESTPIAEDLRGKPEINFDLCVGCGACANVCPPSAITVEDIGTTRVLKLRYYRCIFCGRCEENCPVGAITLTNEFELASLNKEDLTVTAEFELIRCKNCGKAFTTRRQLDNVISSLEAIEVDYKDELKHLSQLCPDCRKAKYSEIISKSKYLRRET